MREITLCYLHAEMGRQLRLHLAAEFVSRENRCAERDDPRTRRLGSVFDKKKLQSPASEQGTPHFRQDSPSRFCTGKPERLVQGVAARKIPGTAFSRDVPNNMPSVGRLRLPF